MLELYVVGAFLAVHFDLLVQLLLVLIVNVGILNVLDSFLVVWWSGGLRRTGLSGLRLGLIRSSTHQCLSFPSAGMQYGLSSRSFRTEYNKVRQTSMSGFIFQQLCVILDA